MTPEKKVKQKVVKLLKSRGCYWFYPVASGFGSAGVPDIVCCYKGKFIGVECKAPAAANRVTALQQKNLTDIRNCGGYGIVVSGDLSELERILDDLEK
jgi:Holliday junction resolvase|tara:strand:- start:551 stop:844 length:294 start_codon:yes stop_codon:yes gene_type:complete